MKKYLNLFLVLVMFFGVGTSIAKAEESDSSTPPFEKRKEVRENMLEVRKENKEEREENREIFKEKKADLMEERKENRGERIENREAFREEMKTKRETFIENLKMNRDAFKEELKVKREEWKNANLEKRKEFWEKSKKMIAERFETAVNNLTKVQERVGEVIEKLNADGKDTTEATESLDSSKDKLEEAKAKTAEIEGLLPANTGETVTPETYEKIKILAREARDLLKESREYLHEAIKNIKSLNLNEDGDSANDEGEENQETVE